MKTILVATDFSNNAANALQYAGGLAGCIGAKIVLFNAFQLSVHASNSLLSPKAYDDMMAFEKTRMEVMAVAVSAQFGVAASTYIKQGFVQEALDEAVAEVNADLVIMGMHANDWGDRLFGNTTTSIITKAQYPVLIIPEEAPFNGIDKILYACDTNKGVADRRLLPLQTFARKLNAEVQVFHVDAPARKAVEKKYVMVTDVEVALCEVDHCYKDVEADDVVEAIEKGIYEFGADLLVMVPHRLSFWEGVLNKSKTRTMALRTQVPLLVLPPSEV